MRKLTFAILTLALAIMSISGCDSLFKNEFGGEPYENRSPDTWLSSGPPEGITDTSYQVSFFWNGYDPDGAVDHYEYLITDDWVTGSLIIDEHIGTILEELGYEWVSINSTDSVFVVEASQSPDFDDPADSEYFYDPNDPNSRFRFFGQHTFFLRTVDEYGLVDPEPAHRSFTATTIAPSVTITRPVMTGPPSDWQNLPPDIFFTWTGNDSVGNGNAVIDPDSTRICIFPSGQFGINPDETTGTILNLPDSIWSRWRGWSEPEDSVLQISGTGALVQGLTPVGVDEPGQYLFFVQAKDEAGAITSHYRVGANFKKLRVSSTLYPRIYAQEPTLGLVVATGFNAYDFTIGQEQTLNVSWVGDASHYGSRVNGYRYGWDIEDPSQEEGWEVNWSLDARNASRQFISGSHNLYIQCRDYSGTTTTILFRLQVVPFTMEKQLLLVDDFDNDQFDEGYPIGEETAFWTSNLARNDDQMKEFWDEMLSDYHNWNPEVDFFRSSSLVSRPPFELVANYQNIVWETARTPRDPGLYRISKFVDPWHSASVPFDYISAFMERGGRLLVCGSTPLFTLMPGPGDMPDSPDRSRTPISYKRHLTYIIGDSEEGVERYLPYRQYGLDILITAVNANPRTPLGSIAWPFVTRHTHWGMVGVQSTYLELAAPHNFPNAYALPETLRMSPETLEWFDYAGEKLEPAGGHGFIGVPDAEIYNWDWYGRYLDPPVVFRQNEYIPLLNYVVADNKTRYGTEPDPTHEATTNDGRSYNEQYWSVPHVFTPGDTLYGAAAGPEFGHAVAVVGLPSETDHRNIVLGFSPYYLNREDAKKLIDHCLVDIMGIDK